MLMINFLLLMDSRYYNSTVGGKFITGKNVPAE
jgi:hypothetical protein